MDGRPRRCHRLTDDGAAALAAEADALHRRTEAAARRPATLAACTVTAAQLLLALYGTATTMWGSSYSAVPASTSLPLALVAAVLLLVVLARTYQGRRACALPAVPAAPVIAKCGEAVAGGTIDGDAGVSRLLIDGLTGLALVMLRVRLAELTSPGTAPATARSTPPDQLGPP